MINIFTTAWDIAIQRPNEKEFIIIQTNYDFWAADPFLFYYNDRLYIFAELWFYKENKGAIGYCCFENEKPVWKTIIKESFHLSYPFLFEINNNIYMCPEAYQSDSIILYKAVSFPDKWEKLSPIKNGIRTVDTTFFRYEENLYGFTFSLDEQALLLFKVNNKDTVSIEFFENNPVNTNLASARMAGNVIKRDGIYIRVSQDCSKLYGEALVFSRFKIEDKNYKEQLIKRITVSDFNINGRNNYFGVHTYNSLNGYQIIDLKYKYINFYDIFYKIVRKIRSFIYG